MAEDLRRFEVKPGDRQISAELINRIVREVIRVGGFDVDGEGFEVDHTAGVARLSTPPQPRGFWAKLTSESSGKYAWTEQERTAADTFANKSNGRSGTTSSSPAVGSNAATGIAANTFVYLTPGRTVISGSTYSQEWVFDDADWAGGGGDHGARATSGTQSVADDGNYHSINFSSSEQWDTDALHDLSVNPERISVIAGLEGMWVGGGTLTFAANATGWRGARLLTSTTEVAVTTVPSVGGSDQTRVSVAGVFYFASTDYFRLQAKQTSGGNLDVSGFLWASGPIKG